MDGVYILMDFEILFDKDYGLIKTMVDKFKGNDYLNNDYLRKVKFNNLINDLLNQEERDPLKLAIKDGIEYNNLYQEIKNDLDFMKSIVDNSHPTKIINFAKEILKLDGNNKVTIYCSNEFEHQKIKDLNLPFSTIIIDDETDIDIYDSIYIKNSLDLINKFKNVKQKHIYIANYKYNINNRYLSKEDLFKLSLDNYDINTIDIY